MKHIHNARAVAIAIVLSLLCMQAQAIEEAKYAVVQQDDVFELRQYEPNVVAQTRVDSTFEKSGSIAFKRLFAYISGANQVKQKIAMTAPVQQRTANIAMTAPVSQQQSDDGQWFISFILPSKYTLESAPKPTSKLVALKRNPKRLMAVIRYSGRWRKSSYTAHKQTLDAWIVQQGLIPVGKAEWARYNAPFTPWFLRRNEVLIPVTKSVAALQAAPQKKSETPSKTDKGE
ncbi:MAG: heme-binding protein [Pseudomonadota bacterium]